MKVTTTLSAIRLHSPCTEGWTKLLVSLNKTKADDEVLELSHILESNGLDDALWCLRAVEGIDKEARLFAVFCARQVQHLSTDLRVSTAIDVAERFAFGLATEEELSATYTAAYDAAYDAYNAAGAAYVNAARAARAAWAARAAAADYAADYAASDAAYAAAYYAASAAAARAVIREEQKQKFIEMFC